MGGLAGGALSAVCATYVLWALRVAVVVVWLALRGVLWLLGLVPQLLYRLSMLLGGMVYGVVLAVVQSVKSV